MIARNNFNGDKIYELRAKLGLNLEEFSQLVKVSPASVSLWERKIAIPYVKSLRRMANNLKMDIEYFFE